MLLDRILSLDTIYVNAIALLIILSIYLNNNLYFEAALLIAVMGFVGTVALSKYLLQWRYYGLRSLNVGNYCINTYINWSHF